MLVAGMRTQKFCSCQNEESGSGTLSIRMILFQKKAELARIRLKTPRLSLDAALLPAPRVRIFEPSYFFSSTKTRSSG